MDTIFSTLFDTNLPKLKILRYTDRMDMTIHTCNSLMTSQELYRRVKVKIKYLHWSYLDCSTSFFSENPHMNATSNIHIIKI